MPKAVSIIVTIENKLGLHARPAMLFVETACKHKAAIAVRRADQDEIVDGKSIMQMMMLAATRGTKLEITADGPDAISASAISSAVAKRSAGLFAQPFSTNASSSAVTSGLNWEGAGVLPALIASATSQSCSPSNKRRPARSSQSTTDAA